MTPDTLAALAFDLDGTLLDSAPDIAAALNAALAAAGLPPADIDQVRAWIGDGPDRLIERALAAIGHEPAAPRVAALRAGFDAATLAAPLRLGRVYDGIEPLLQRLAPRWPLVVVTNKPSHLARAVLDAAGLLTPFAAVYGADRPAWRKPAPAMLHAAARQLGVAAPALLMIGDSAPDLQAARAAGSPMLLAGWGYGDGSRLAPAADAYAERPEAVGRLLGAA